MAIGKPAALAPEESQGTPAISVVNPDGSTTQTAADKKAAAAPAVTPSLAFAAEGGTEQNSVVEAARANAELATNPGTMATAANETAKGKIVKTDKNAEWDDFWADLSEGHIAAREGILNGKAVRKLTCTAAKREFYRIWK